MSNWSELKTPLPPAEKLFIKPEVLGAGNCCNRATACGDSRPLGMQLPVHTWLRTVNGPKAVRPLPLAFPVVGSKTTLVGESARYSLRSQMATPGTPEGERTRSLASDCREDARSAYRM